MPFEVFASDNPTHIVLGLFDGLQLLAVYMFCEYDRGHFEAHFTSSRDTPKQYVSLGAKTALDWFVSNGAIEVSAFIMARNTPLRRFVEALGFHVSHSDTETACQCDTDGATITSPTGALVKYVVKGIP